MKKGNLFENILYILLSILLFISFYIASVLPANASGTGIGGINYNFITFALIILSSYTTVGCVYLCFKKSLISDNNIKLSSKFNHVFFRITLVLFTVIIYLIYHKENLILGSRPPGTFLRNNHHLHVGYFFFLLFISLLVMSITTISKTKTSIIRILTMIGISSVCFLLLYAPNPDMDSYGKIYHIDAYVNSIIHVANFVPYDEYNISIYGHYGILYLPLVKIFGNSFNAVAIAVALVGAFSYFCMLYASNTWIKNDIIYLVVALGMLGSIVLLYLPGQHFQTIPHRILFASITLVTVTLLLQYKVTEFKSFIIASIVGGLSFLWNTETGGVCILVFMMFFFVKSLSYKDKKYSFKSFFKTSIECGLYLLASVFLAFFILHIYNFCCSIGSHMHWVSFKEFIYPIGSDTYNINYLRLPLPSPFSLYLVEIIVFSIILLNYFIVRDRGIITDKDIFKFCVSISGLGCLTYFMNRAAYSNVSISWLQFIVILGIVSEDLFKKLSNKSEFFTLKNAAKIFCYIGLTMFAIESGLYFTKAVNSRANSSWNKKQYMDSINEIKSSIPKDTFAFGTGVEELYFTLGWNTGLHVTDWPDMNRLNYEKVLQELSSKNNFFARINDKMAYNSFPILDKVKSEFNLIKTFQIGNNQYAYYERITTNQNTKENN